MNADIERLADDICKKIGKNQLNVKDIMRYGPYGRKKADRLVCAIRPNGTGTGKRYSCWDVAAAIYYDGKIPVKPVKPKVKRCG